MRQAQAHTQHMHIQTLGRGTQLPGPTCSHMLQAGGQVLALPKRLCAGDVLADDAVQLPCTQELGGPEGCCHHQACLQSQPQMIFTMFWSCTRGACMLLELGTQSTSLQKASLSLETTARRH